MKSILLSMLPIVGLCLMLYGEMNTAQAFGIYLIVTSLDMHAYARYKSMMDYLHKQFYRS